MTDKQAAAEEALESITRAATLNYTIADERCWTELRDRVRAYIDELEANQPRWIPVSERLPEVDQYVLTFGEWGIDVGRYTPKFWELAGGDNLATVEEVTHWMELPLPPKPD